MMEDLELALFSVVKKLLLGRTTADRQKHGQAQRLIEKREKEMNDFEMLTRNSCVQTENYVIPMSSLVQSQTSGSV